MNLQEIKAAIKDGKKVKWSNDGYDVIKDTTGQHLIVFAQNQNCTGLTHKDGVTLNGKEEDFYIEEETPAAPSIDVTKIITVLYDELARVTADDDERDPYTIEAFKQAEVYFKANGVE